MKNREKKQKLKGLISIRTTLFVTILSLCLIPLLIISSIFIISSARKENSDFITNAHTLNQIALNLLQDKITYYESTLSSTIEHESFDKSSDPNYQHLQNTLKTIANSEPSILNLYFCSEKDEFIQCLDEGIDDFLPTQLDWYQTAIANKGKVSFETPYADSITGDMTFTMYKAVEKDGKFIGVLGIDISLSSLAPQLESIHYGTDGELIVTDSNGSIISCTDHSKLGTLEPTEYSSWSQISSNDSGSVNFVYNQTSYTSTYDTSSINGWKFIFRIPTQELTSAQAHYIILLRISILVLTIICGFIIFLLTSILCKSIYAISAYIESTSNGHFNEKMTLKTHIREFVLLSNNLNTMQSNISHIISQFNEGINNMSSHTDTFLKESKNIAISIDQITGTMSEISKGTSESSISLETINTSVEHLSSNMEHIKAATENVSLIAHKANELGESGKNISAIVQTSSNQTKLSTKEVNKAIQEVAEKVESIRIMSTAISNITEQTNLLALNATIEAARAGEAGKGFAVVAGEISKLSDETAVSAQQINNVVKTIEDFVNTAVMKVEETSHIVDSQEETVKQSQVIFSDIVHSVQTLSEKVQEIVSQLENVNHIKNNVLEQVESLSSILEETVAGTESTADSAVAVQNSTGQFVDSISYLSQLADELHKHISKFKF